MVDKLQQHFSVANRVGTYYLQSQDYCLPLYKDGVELTQFGNGWDLLSVYSAFAPLLLIELKHESGARATWFFDSAPKFIGNNAADLPLPYRDILICKATPILAEILASIYEVEQPVPSLALEYFFELSHSVRVQIWELCRSRVVKNSSINFIDTLPEFMLIHLDGCSSGPVRVIDKKYLNLALDQNFQLRAIAALSDGHFSWPGIVDERLHSCRASLILNDYDQIYKFIDVENNISYFVLVTGHAASVCGIYIPSMNSIITKGNFSRAALDRFSNIDENIVEYSINFYSNKEFSNFSNSLRRPCILMRERHLGHQLWNELSGLEVIIDTTAPEYYPEILVFGGRSTEAFGRIDAIFPEFQGKIAEGVETLGQINKYIQTNYFILLRINSGFISKRLRERIVINSDSLGLSESNSLTPPKNKLCVVFGIRVENRTAVDLLTFICETLEYISTIAPGCHVILDGQNIREGYGNEPLGGFGHESAVVSPLQFELDLLEKAVAHVANRPLTVVVTSGQTISQSLMWIKAADCFIAIFGAGLAKYRWLVNKPGFVISSRYHLLNPGEISIYNSAHIMENPTELTYAKPSYVNDDPDAWQLIPLSGPRHFSFNVEIGAFLEDISKFLKPFI